MPDFSGVQTAMTDLLPIIIGFFAVVLTIAVAGAIVWTVTDVLGRR